MFMDFVMWRKALNTIIARTTTAPSSMGYGYMKKLEVYGLANIKSAKKRILITEARTARNKSIRSAVKTAIKKVDAAVAANDKAAAQEALPKAVSAIGKATAKGVYHKNTAARKVSRLNKAVNTLA